MIGVELVRGMSHEGNSRGNEARRLGEEMDEKLVAHEVALDKLGSAARQKKSRARKAEGADEKIAAIDAKLVSDKAALAAEIVVLERLPDAKVKIEVKRERPPKPAPVSEPQPSPAASTRSRFSSSSSFMSRRRRRQRRATCTSCGGRRGMRESKSRCAICASA